jgi:tetratricopeptide (TPR) repeat protein
MSKHRRVSPSIKQQAQGSGIVQVVGESAKALVIFLTTPGLWWAISALALALLAVGMLATFRGFSIRVLQLTPTPTPWTLPSTPTPDEMLVLVVQFEQLGGVGDRDPSGRIIETLQASMPGQIADRVRFFEVPEAFGRGEQDAVRDLGTQLNATIVIWGAYDPAGATAHFTVIPETPPDFEPVEFQLGPSMAQIRDFDFYFNHQLPSEATFFVDFTIGQLFYWSASYESALRMFDGAILSGRSVQGTDLGALAYSYFYRGYIYQTHLRDLGEAVLNYTEAISLNVNLSSAYNNLGAVYADQGEYGRAISMFERATRVDVTNDVAWGNLGLASYHCDDMEMAITAYERAIELQPDSASLHVNLALWHAAQGEYALAMAEINRALTVDADYAPAYINRASLELRLNKLESASADLERACQLMSGTGCTIEGPILTSYPMLYYNLGELARIHKDDPITAIAYYQRAIELAPEDSRAYYGIAQAEIVLADYEQAIAHLLRFMELSTDLNFRAEVQAQLRELEYTGPWPKLAEVPDCTP